MERVNVQISIKCRRDSISLRFLEQKIKEARNVEDCILLIQRIDNQLILVFSLLHTDYINDLYKITREYYGGLIAFINSTFIHLKSGEHYTWSIEIPIYTSPRNHVLLQNLIQLGYHYRTESSYIRSITGVMLKMSFIGDAYTSINNIYHVILLIIRINNPHAVRHEMAINEFKLRKINSLLDLGCRNGSFLFNCACNLSKIPLYGIDIDETNIQIAKTTKVNDYDNLDINFLTADILKNITIKDFEAVSLIEVIEHLTFSELEILFDNIFENINPKFLLITTPNRDYNAYLELNLNSFRHKDHKFEMSKDEFVIACDTLSVKFNCVVEVKPIGIIKENGASISQMAVFERKNK